uniref:ANK_REP_REGION domain-containing protein n=1 Tax=Meloidogyne hapla TaxID=6305 RepID=A0A1I8BTQ6_MELHA
MTSSSVEDENERLFQLYPLHYMVFNNDIERLKSKLESSEELKENINKLDIHGRTPIMLATMLGHIECAELLLDNGAEANTQNKRKNETRKFLKIKKFVEMWSLSHEAILLKNVIFLQKVLAARDYERYLETSRILKQIRNSFKIYKHGNSIRIDANLLEISNDHTLDKTRGSQSFIFRFGDSESAEIIFIDRDEKTAYSQNFDLSSLPKIDKFISVTDLVEEKLKSPITVTYVDVDNIGFEPSKKNSRLFSWIGSSDKEEEVEGYTCRVFSASNVEVVTKTCFCHLSEEDKELSMKENPNKSVALLLSLFEKRKVDVSGCPNQTDVYNGLNVVDYLTKPSENGKANIGISRDEHFKSNSFNASLWLSESFPLNLREQIFHVIDLLAVRNAKFLRLKRFIELQMPAGFPIRIKIPVFHLINAQITFHNVNEPETEDIDQSTNEDECPEFRLKDSLFQIPDGFQIYKMAGNMLFNRFDEIEYVRHRQDFGSRDVWTRDIEDGDEYYCLIERFIDGESSKTPTYERQLQQAIEESLEATRQYNQPQISETSGQQSSAHESNEEEVDAELLNALKLSKQEEELRAKQLEEEEEQYREALERSMLDK